MSEFKAYPPNRADIEKPSTITIGKTETEIIRVLPRGFRVKGTERIKRRNRAKRLGWNPTRGKIVLGRMHQDDQQKD